MDTDRLFVDACTRHSGTMTPESTCCFVSEGGLCLYDAPKPAPWILATDNFLYTWRRISGIIWIVTLAVFLFMFTRNGWWQWINFSYYITFIYLFTSHSSHLPRILTYFLPITIVFVIFSAIYLPIWGYTLPCDIIWHTYSGLAIFTVIYCMRPTEKLSIILLLSIAVEFIYEAVEIFFFYIINQIIMVDDLIWEPFNYILDIVNNIIGECIGALLVYLGRNIPKKEVALGEPL